MKVKKSAILSEEVVEIIEPCSKSSGSGEPKLSLPRSSDAVFTSDDGEVYEPVSGCHDMIVAFDTTGSMAAYIDAIRKEVAILIPQLFAENKGLRLGIIAFGDYCDISSGGECYGGAFQRIQPTSSIPDLVDFVRNSADTWGGDENEFYELVIKKIVEETPWRPNSERSVLLIADAGPHELGYTYEPFVYNNPIDWRKEAQKAAEKHIKFDTVSIRKLKWLKELSKITNGVCSPFRTGSKTGHLIRAAVLSRGSSAARASFDTLQTSCTADRELREVYKAYEVERYPSRRGS